MTPSDKKSAGTRSWVWVLAITAFIVVCWAVLAHWPDFKQGMLEGYTRRAGRQP